MIAFETHLHRRADGSFDDKPFTLALLASRPGQSRATIVRDNIVVMATIVRPCVRTRHARHAARACTHRGREGRGQLSDVRLNVIDFVGNGVPPSRRQTSSRHSLTDKTTILLHTTLCPYSHVQAMRSAHLLDGAVPS